MSRVSNGVMDVEINGNDYRLKATVAAIESIEQKFSGGMAAAAQACMQISFSNATFIIAKGANLNKDQQKQLKTDIVADGIEAAATIAAEYIAMLMNPNAEEESEDEPAGEL